MPDHTGRLTPDDETKARAWFARNWKGPVLCPVCKTDGWMTGSHVIQVKRWAQDEFAAPVFPYVTVACTSCHHTLLFNAVAMGIIQPAPPPPPIAPNPYGLIPQKSGG